MTGQVGYFGWDQSRDLAGVFRPWQQEGKGPETGKNLGVGETAAEDFQCGWRKCAEKCVPGGDMWVMGRGWRVRAGMGVCSKCSGKPLRILTKWSYAPICVSDLMLLCQVP